jgi:hypothetical protein
MGLCMSVYVSFNCIFSWLSLYMLNRSSVFINGPFFSMCRMSSLSSIVPYACCVSKMCWAYLQVVLLECMACICSLYRVLKFLPVWPMHLFAIYTITFSKLCKNIYNGM